MPRLYDLKPGSHFAYDYDASRIFKLIGFNSSPDGDKQADIIMVAAFWTHENEWKLCHSQPIEQSYDCNVFPATLTHTITLER